MQEKYHNFLPALCYSKYASKIAILRVTIIQKDKKLEFDIEANNLKQNKKGLNFYKEEI